MKNVQVITLGDESLNDPSRVLLGGSGGGVGFGLGCPKKDWECKLNVDESIDTVGEALAVKM